MERWRGGGWGRGVNDEITLIKWLSTLCNMYAANELLIHT